MPWTQHVRSLKENENKNDADTQNLKEADEISGTCNQEERLGEFNNYRTYRWQNGEKHAAGPLLDELVLMDGVMGV